MNDMEEEYQYKYFIEATYSDGCNDSNATDDYDDVINILCHMVLAGNRCTSGKVTRNGEVIMSFKR